MPLQGGTSGPLPDSVMQKERERVVFTTRVVPGEEQTEGEGGILRELLSRLPKVRFKSEEEDGTEFDIEDNQSGEIPEGSNGGYGS